MMTCDGYKMFHGTVKITPAALPDEWHQREPFEITGTWFFRADVRVWYVQPDNGGFTRSFIPEVLSDFKED